jgi:endonuclease YncB( thermonuclease family)
MSAGHGSDALAKYALIGTAIIVIAFLYDLKGWDFLTRDISFVSEKGPTIVNEDGIRGDMFFDVTNVLDASTITVTIDGVEEVVRLVGINTPEAQSSDRDGLCIVNQAIKRLRKLVLHEHVKIETDRSQGTRDPYGRILAYVYLQDGQMVNRKMIAEGYSYEYTYLAPYRYQKDFRAIQNIARASERGIWSDSFCPTTQ